MAQIFINITIFGHIIKGIYNYDANKSKKCLQKVYSSIANNGNQEKAKKNYKVATSIESSQNKAG